jgi:hypothetical protein
MSSALVAAEEVAAVPVPPESPVWERRALVTLGSAEERPVLARQRDFLPTARALVPLEVVQLAPVQLGFELLAVVNSFRYSPADLFVSTRRVR